MKSLPKDYELVVVNLKAAAVGLPANTMARILGKHTPGVSWYGCSKSYIAEQFAVGVDRYDWRGAYQKLRDELAKAKRPPTKKQRRTEKQREQSLLEDEHAREVDEWLGGDHEPSDIEGQIEYAGDMVAQHRAQLDQAKAQESRLRSIRTSLRKKGLL